MTSHQNTNLVENTSIESTGIEDTGLEFEFSRMDLDSPTTAVSRMNFSLLSDIDNEESIYYPAEDVASGADPDASNDRTQGADSDVTDHESEETDSDETDGGSQGIHFESIGSDEDDDALTKAENRRFKEVFGKTSFDLRKVPVRPKPWNEWSLKDFEYGKPLGNGAYGQVDLARTVTEKFIVALKVMLPQPNDLYIENEFNIHARLSHPNIIKLYGSFVDNEKCVFVLEYAPGGDVFQHMKCQPEGRFTDGIAATYIDQVADALQYLHSRNILHRDIKPENLLLGYFGEIKMADFGNSCQLERGPAHTLPRYRKRYTYCGTAEYIPPEAYMDQGYDGKLDIWALGVLAFEFLTGEEPFNGADRAAMAANILYTPHTFPDVVSRTARDFIDKILIKTPEVRISLEEIREHAWVIQNKSTEGKSLLPQFDKFKHMETIVAKKYMAAGEDLVERRRIAEALKFELTSDSENDYD